MGRQYYLDIAEEGKKMVFGVDLVLKEKPNHEEILLNGTALGQVVLEATRRFDMPLALPCMDLDVEKQELLNLLDKDLTGLDSFHFDHSNISDETLAAIQKNSSKEPTPRLRATCEAITRVAENSDYLPVGMCIGPFSFITKLLADPISPVFMYSMGVSGKEDPEIKILELAIEIATELIMRSVKMQIAAGAKAICVCEPAANNVYISPDTLTEDFEDVFDKLVLKYNFRIKDILNQNNVDLILHDCGELSDLMVKKLCKLDPVILSLGSSRKLYEDAKIVPDDIVLFGNLPSKQFFMDDEITKEKVTELTSGLDKKMKATGHPYILGSECDILSVDGHEDLIKEKVNLMLGCDCGNNHLQN
jgi:uroporphyrinogen-III decarboxylase